MTAQPARQGAAPVARKKSKALPIAIAAALALVVIAAAAFGITRLFGTAAPSGEPVVTVPPSVGSVGEQVIFGTWRDEPLTWRVLAIEDRRALLISENVLTVRQYDDLGVTSSGQIDWNAAETTWATSDVRAWLNGEFLNATFNTELQEAIASSPIVNPDNLESGAAGGENTEDRVFLLSIDEAERYFADDEDRIAYCTMAEEDIQYELAFVRDYYGYSEEDLAAEENRLRENSLGQRQAGWWWLRSPGSDRNDAAGVAYGGGVYVVGSSANNGICHARPVAQSVITYRRA